MLDSVDCVRGLAEVALNLGTRRASQLSRGARNALHSELNASSSELWVDGPHEDVTGQWMCPSPRIRISNAAVQSTRGPKWKAPKATLKETWRLLPT